MSIEVNVDMATETVSTIGELQHLVTNSDRADFKIEDSELKHALDLQLGKTPNDAYLREETPWDLYPDYGWSETVTKMTPEAEELISNTAEDVIVSENSFINNSSVPVSYNTGIEYEVTETSSNTWSAGGAFTFEQMISYKFLGMGGETTMAYEASWGVDETYSQAVTIGSSSGMDVLLQPGQGVVVKLKSTIGTMTVKVDYRARLNGDATANYDNAYEANGFDGKHHFYCCDLNYIMQQANISNDVTSSELVDVESYFNTVIEVEDIVTKKTLLTYKLPNRLLTKDHITQQLSTAIA